MTFFNDSVYVTSNPTEKESKTLWRLAEDRSSYKKVYKGSFVAVWCRDGDINKQSKYLENKTVYKVNNFKETTFFRYVC